MSKIVLTMCQVKAGYPVVTDTLSAENTAVLILDTNDNYLIFR